MASIIPSKNKNFLVLVLLSIVISFPAFPNSWLVGSSHTYTVPSQVRNLVADGDTIYIEGGVYLNDATKWAKRDLKIIGLGTGSNRTTMRYNGDIPNHKGIFVFETPGVCDNAYIENIVFDGAQVSDADGGNGAGIRFQATNLTVKDCKFVNCQNGILEGNGAVSTSNVIILNCEFENNGYQLPNAPGFSGFAHHIYISASVDTLLVMNNLYHHPRGQANSIKTRAQRAFILYNYIDEDASGYGSWEINIAQGGLNIVLGNVIIQGSSSANHGIIGYDAVSNPIEDFYFVNNTVINQYAGNASYFNIAPTNGIDSFKVYNNIFASIAGSQVSLFNGNLPGGLDTSNNSFSGDYLAYGFNDPVLGDYSLTVNATSAIDGGINAGFSHTSFSLTPDFMYQSFNANLLPRYTLGSAIDIGAYEYDAPTKVQTLAHEKEVTIYPNPTTGKFRIIFSEQGHEYTQLVIYNTLGSGILRAGCKDMMEFDLSSLIKGTYFLKISGSKGPHYEKIILE